MPVRLKPSQNEVKNAVQRPFLVFDFETVKWTQFLVAGIYDGHSFTYYRDLGSFLDFLFFRYPGYDCFAHFGGRFDFLFVLAESLGKRGIKIGTIIPRGSGILTFSLKRGHSELFFRDSSALFPFSLARLTEAFNVDHKKQVIDYDKIRIVTPELLEYLEYDCRGLHEALTKFFDWPIIKKAGRSYTLAGQALRVLRLYLKEDVCSLTDSVDRIIRPAYQGGRVEIFRPFFRPGNASTKRGKYLHCYDVNSLYPTVMQGNSFPNEFDSETDTFEKSAVGFYQCEVEVPEKTYLPFLGTNHKGKYIFPTGKFQGLYSIPEINYARSVGTIIRPLNGYLFTKGGKLFSGFVDELYRIRCESPRDSVDNVITKLLLNSCYGRFGLSKHKENVVLDDGSCGLKPLREVKVNGKYLTFMTKEVKIETFTNVAIAAYVTAYARIHMHRIMAALGEDIYYTDTDSIFTTKKLPTGDGLGELKLEYSVDSACFLLPKTYIAGEKIVMKGFDKKKIQHFTMDDFLACLEGDLKRLSIIQEPRFATFKTALRMGALVTMTKASSRQIRSIYDKRILVKDGDDWNTKPIHLKG